MNRRAFFRTSFIATTAIVVAPSLILQQEDDYKKELKVGQQKMPIFYLFYRNDKNELEHKAVVTSFHFPKNLDDFLYKNKQYAIYIYEEGYHNGQYYVRAHVEKKISKEDILISDKYKLS